VKLIQKDTLFNVLLVTVVLACIAAVLLMPSDFLGGGSEATSENCTTKHKNHVAVIKNNKVTPAHITAPRCDTLTIVNEDGRGRLIAFGVHDNHVPYDGVAQRALSHGEQFTVTLVKTGDYLFHDHEEEEVGGTFTVTESN
jgi:plastocyanin